MAKDKSNFVKVKVQSRNNTQMKSKGRRYCCGGNLERYVTKKDVLLIPNLKENLLSFA